MTTLISLLLFLIFAFLSSLHFYWGLGGRRGSQAVFPTKDDSIPSKMPGSIPTFMVAFGLLAFGFFVLQKGGLLNFKIPMWLDTYGLWIMAGIFIVRAIGDFKYVGFFKKIKHTPFGQNDTKYYSPLCLIIGVLTILLVLNT